MYPSTPLRGGYSKVGMELRPGGGSPVLPLTLYPFYNNKGYVGVQGYRSRLVVTPAAFPWAVGRGYGTGTDRCWAEGSHAMLSRARRKSLPHDRVTVASRTVSPTPAYTPARSGRPNPRLAGLYVLNMTCFPYSENSPVTVGTRNGVRNGRPRIVLPLGLPARRTENPTRGIGGPTFGLPAVCQRPRKERQL